ncbi:mitochondrial proton/calcium exchanger protein-like protein isoform X1 [Tanacetum coccineum]|uniref:Mitochondrial proton/calcium exchanger protein-like protein isoform X1 n=1 Tax=Tanacetum coccineum TaxID=301880 RepID=A0ABQ4YU20_9ASTR
MTKVIKGEFEKIKDVKVDCDTPVEVFNKEVSRLSGMDNDLFTYEVEGTNIPCNSKIDDDSEHEADDDMGYDPSDIRGDDEVELTDEESSDDEDEIAKVFRIDTNIFNYETLLCSAFNEFNYLLKVDPDLLIKDIMGFKTYEDYKDDWIYEWNKDVPWVYDKPWLDNGIWKEPTLVKHTCKPFNYKTVILFYNGLGIPTRHILDSRGAIPSKTVADAKVAIQEMPKYSQKWHNGTSRSGSTETSDGLAAIQAQLNNHGREVQKVNEKVYVAQVGCKQCKGPHYTKDCPLKKKGKTLEEAYYTQFVAHFQGGGYRATAPGFYQRNNVNPSYQERRQSMEDTLSKFISESAKRHEENSNLIKEIRASTDAAIRNQGASVKTLEIQIGQMSKVLQKRGFGRLPSSTEANPKDQVKSISTTIEVDSYPIRRIGSSQYVVSTGQNHTLMYETRQTTIPFPSHLNGYCCEEKKGSYGPHISEAYSKASHIDNFIPRKEKNPGRASFSVMPLSTYLNLGLGGLAHTKLTVELAYRTMKYPKGIAKNVLVGIGKFVFLIDFIILDMPEDIKVPLILGRPFLSTARAKIDVFKRNITLRVGEERIIFKSVKPASSLIKRVYMLSLRERMELDLEARLIGETLVLNRSSDPLDGDYIELNDLNEPLKLRRDQGDDLMPTIEEGEVIEEFRTRDEDLDNGIDDYPCYCDHDKKIHIDYAHNLKFSCMIGFEFTHVNFFPLLYVNVTFKKFHNSIIKDKMVYKGNNVVGALMNVPVFVGTFFVVTNFAVLEDMDVYRDKDMGDVIFGEPFLKKVRINARRFDGMIIIYNGNDEVTYQMVRSHPRFKHHTNEQCNKIPPLLKVSEEDKMNGISHAYQK